MIGRADIEAAYERISPYIRRTPVVEMDALALGLDFPVTLKMEHLQATGSFKLRGAFNNLLTQALSDAGVVATSGGNHGAGVAYAATALGKPSTIYVPASIAAEVKLRRMRGFGADVVAVPDPVGQAYVECQAHAARTGALEIHPFDSDATLAGQGTVALELSAQAEIDTLLVSVGGDWTRNTPAVEYPYLRDVYAALGAEGAVGNAHFADEQHDYGPSKRRAVVAFLARELGLDRGGVLVLLLVALLLVVVARDAHDRARVHEAGRDDRRLEHLEAGGDLHGVSGPDLGDLAVPEEDDAVLDGGAGHGVDHAAADRHLGGGAGRERGEGEGESGECVAVSHQSWSPWLSSPKQQ